MDKECMMADINLDKPPATTNIQDGFTEVKYRRRNRNNLPRTSISGLKNLGTQGIAPVSEKDIFRAKPSKMWLYVRKVINTVTESIVKDYIKNQIKITDSDKVEVYKLSLLGKSHAFQVGIDASLFEKVNCADFWPNGIRRFHFDFRWTNFTDMELLSGENETYVLMQKDMCSRSKTYGHKDTNDLMDDTRHGIVLKCAHARTDIGNDTIRNKDFEN
ncbi:hypothetical protein WA026_015104 [Henosepilachna vigintioctopunctata]|uniref:Uncharacterized protein n=1 Tax=Henosepilachna vigintioctopunctata TaxID=420089 RepID=A0AAW1TT52_9CUCU